MGTIVKALVEHDVIDHEEVHAGYAPEWDGYKARLAAVERLAPGLSDACYSPLVLLNEEVAALVNAAWLAGAEYGERLMKGEIVPSGGD